MTTRAGLVLCLALAACGGGSPLPATPGAASALARSNELRLAADWDGARTVVEHALAAPALDADTEARLLLELATLERECGSYRRADRKSAAAAALAKAEPLLATASAATRAVFAEERGWNVYFAAFETGTFDDALPMFTEALKLREGTADHSGLAWSYFEVGLVHQQAGRLDEAQRAFDSGMAIATKHGLLVEQGYLVRHLGAVEEGRSKDPKRAIPFFERSLALREQAGHRWGVVFAALTLGDFVAQAGDVARARELYTRAGKLGTELAVHRGAAVAAESLAKLDEADRAAACRHLADAHRAWTAHGSTDAADATHKRRVELACAP